MHSAVYQFGSTACFAAVPRNRARSSALRSFATIFFAPVFTVNRASDWLPSSGYNPCGCPLVWASQPRYNPGEGCGHAEGE